MIEVICELCEERLDKYLSERLGVSRSEISKYISEGRVKINGEEKKPSHRTKIGDIITYEKPEPICLDILPENLPIDVIYEDASIIAVNKPKGMIVHPAGKIVSGTLVNALLNYTKELSDINGVIRPGIVHRLDKDTTGILVIAKNKQSHLSLLNQLKERSVEKVYYALVFGHFREKTGVIELPLKRSQSDRKKIAVDLNGRESITFYRVVRSFKKYSLLRIIIKTGRTHQIRVHMAHLGHPVVGDYIYHSGKNEFGIKGQLLHSYSLAFINPSEDKYIKFSAPFPEDFSGVISTLKEREK